MKTQQHNQRENSDFWLGNETSFLEKHSYDEIDLYRLASYRRAISNFVFFLAKKNIPVRFAENSTSMTDGKVVYIGGELSRGEFDVTVGLCLHEASHIVHSDFDALKTLWGKIPERIRTAANGKIDNSTLGDYCKYVMNVVEDRYIDAWAYEQSPGYRGYYQALYRRYYNLPEIDGALRSENFRDPTWESYRFRFTNLINPNSDLDALPGLRKINDLLDVENILRTDTSSFQQRLELAFDITEEIVYHIVKEQNEKEEEKSDPSDSGDPSPGDGDGTPDNKNTPSDEPPKEEQPTPPVDQEVAQAIDKQQNFVLRKQERTPFTPDDRTMLEILENTETECVDVGGECGVEKIQCVVVKKMTKELVEHPQFPFSIKTKSISQTSTSAVGVKDGLVLGTMLGKRLQIRNEVRTTKNTRLDTGKIDRRLLAQIGAGIENVFYQTTTNKYKKVHIHISVDASSSMGSCWKKTMTMLVAVAKAASMINNVVVVISLRAGTVSGYREYPYIVIAYDSLKDQFSKVAQLFPFLIPHGTTPEGLAFQSILGLIPPSTHEQDSYFLNLSDGEPYFTKYTGEPAALHTKRQVEKMEAAGVEILSYFITTNDGKEHNKKMFSLMYGRNAQFIDVENITQISHTLNKRFLTR